MSYSILVQIYDSIVNLYALKCSPKKRLYFTTNTKNYAFVVKNTA